LVWAGSTTTEEFDKQGAYYFVQNGFDADGEVGETLDVNDFLPKNHNANAGLGRPTNTYFTWADFWVTATHATTVTDVVSIFLQASVDGTAWDNLCEVTDADAYTTDTTTGNSDVVAATAFPTINYRYFRISCTTVGAGNTLIGYAKIW
jgi:hypothetical protein